MGIEKVLKEAENKFSIVKRDKPEDNEVIIAMSFTIEHWNMLKKSLIEAHTDSSEKITKWFNTREEGIIRELRKPYADIYDKLISIYKSCDDCRGFEVQNKLGDFLKWFAKEFDIKQTTVSEYSQRKELNNEKEKTNRN